MAPISAVIVGAGHRAMCYAAYSELCPDELRIVGVADPVEGRRVQAMRRFGFGGDACFGSAEELAARGRIADAAINGTMDPQHVPTSLPLLAAGYDLLLEKPFAVNETEMWALHDAARDAGRKVMICHVLRYAPFYAAIRERLEAGEIGRVMNLQTTEHVSYHHMAVAFVRGKWNRRDRGGSSMLMAKCCHDMDLLAWMKSGLRPVRVASFGSTGFFRPDRAPEGAGTQCLVDCPIEADCPYSARKHYLDHPERWRFYVWEGLEDIEEPTLTQKEEDLKTSPYGRCVWKCGNDTVDRQSVTVEFEDGATATHNLVGGTARPERSIHLLGERGEIQGDFSTSRFTIRHFDPRPGQEYTEEVVDLEESGDMHGAFGGHGGGDQRLVSDFVRFARGEPTSLSCTRLEDSVSGHRIGFAADRAMAERQVVELGAG